jgi:UDP-N-acetyl-2-amino-2-deoxyglucuronate dehydrogenase
MLKGGILGFGGVGQLKTDSIQRSYDKDDVAIVIMYDVDKTKHAIAHDKYGLEVADSPEDLVNRDLDFVIVSSPNAFHCEQAILAAQAGKAVLLEKPAALTIQELAKLSAAVEKAGVINVVDYSSRFGEYHIQLRELIRNGDLGNILEIWFNHTRDFGLAAASKKHWAVQHPDQSGGWILHHMCHAVDLTYWLLGEFNDVYCQTRTTFPDPESPEMVTCIANMKCGAQATLMDRTSTYRISSLGVVGEKATVVLQGPKNQRIMEMKNESTGKVTRFPAASASKRATDHFIRCIKGKETSQCHIKESCHSIRVCLAMIQSSHEGRVVKLDNS